MTQTGYRFGDIEIVTSRREILRGGESIAVEPKVYDLILYLVENRDRAVDKNELQDAIWPSVIVTETALTRCVMKARQVMLDSAADQRIIRTVRSHGYRLIADIEVTGGDETPTPETGRGEERIRIAVMPFRDLSRDADRNILADGLCQDIIRNLSRNTWLFVIAAGSSFAYRERQPTPAEVKSELGARYVVEGTVQHSADRVRVTAAMVDTATAAQEWSERYDRPLADLFEIQDEISLGIAASLGSSVRRAEARRAEKADPDALDAWGLVHRGIARSWSRFSRKSNLEAEALYRRAIELAPENPAALALLGSSIAMKVSNGWSGDIGGDAAEAWDLGKRATHLAPDDAMVLTHWGHTHVCLGCASDAVPIYERARELDPSSAMTLGVMSLALTGAGRADEAIDAVSQALLLSPRDVATHWYLAAYSFAYLQLGQYEDVVREARRAIASYRGWQPPWVALAIGLAGVGQFEDAAAAAKTAAELEPLVGLEGFKKYFRHVVRDEAHGNQVDAWLERIWPE